MIQKFAGFSLTVIDLFLLGLVLTQCGPYVIYSFGLGEMPVYLNDCAATEWSLLLVLLSVAEVLIFYYVGRMIQKNFVVHRQNRIPYLFVIILRVICWLLSVVFTLLTARMLIELAQTSTNISNMVLRTQFGQLGIFAIIISKLQLALLLLTFDEALKAGKCTWQFICSFAMGLPGWILVGQRSALIAPFILISLNYYNRKRTLSGKKVFAIAALASACIILGYTYSYKVGSWGDTIMSLVSNVYARDFDTLWTLSAVLDRANTYSQILPYPGAGYVNALLAFFPRSLFPVKGFRDAVWFTMWIGKSQGIALGASTVAQMNWAYKFSYVTELVINFGVLGVIALSPCYGLLLAWMDRLSRDKYVCYGPILWVAFNLWWLDLFSIITGMAFVVLVASLLEQKGKSSQVLKEWPNLPNQMKTIRKTITTTTT